MEIGECSIRPEELFSVEDSRRTRGHPFKIKVPRTSRDTRRRFFAVRIISDWNSLSSEAVTADSLPKFKGFLHRELGDRLFEYV